MIADTAIHLILTWYIETVFPGNNLFFIKILIFLTMSAFFRWIRHSEAVLFFRDQVVLVQDHANGEKVERFGRNDA